MSLYLHVSLSPCLSLSPRSLPPSAGGRCVRGHGRSLSFARGRLHPFHGGGGNPPLGRSPMIARPSSEARPSRVF
eukprot:2937479-Prymnesium_polylepis.1